MAPMAFSSYSGKTVSVFNTNGTTDFEVATPTYAFDVAFISHENTLAGTSEKFIKKCITIIDIQSKNIQKTIQVDSTYYGLRGTDGNFMCSAAGNEIQLINPHNKSPIEIVSDKTIHAYCYAATFYYEIHHKNNKSNSVTYYNMICKVL